ncbi:hypothetical protein GCM10010230_20750 [Streptomyces narbonensis]|nr:hypothetical protein GCM10010230_20750 [Streptomyces narbonensis]
MPRASEDRREAPGKPPGPTVALLDLTPVSGETLWAVPGPASQQPRIAVDHPRGATARGELPIQRPISLSKRGGQQSADLIRGEAGGPGEVPDPFEIKIVQQPHGNAEQRVLLTAAGQAGPNRHRSGRHPKTVRETEHIAGQRLVGQRVEAAGQRTHDLMVFRLQQLKHDLPAAQGE